MDAHSCGSTGEALHRQVHRWSESAFRLFFPASLIYPRLIRLRFCVFSGKQNAPENWRWELYCIQTNFRMCDGSHPLEPKLWAFYARG